jgi:hypothetical protein
MGDPQNQQRIANEFLKFGTKASNAGLSYLQDERQEKQIEQVEFVASQKVLKENLKKAEMLGRGLASDNPKISENEIIIQLQKLEVEKNNNPKWPQFVAAINEGHLLKRAELGLAKYNADIVENAEQMSLDIEKDWLNLVKEQNEAGIETTPTLVEFGAEHLTSVSSAAMDSLINPRDDKGNLTNVPNRYRTILSAPGKRINYDSISKLLADRHSTLVKDEQYQKALSDTSYKITEILNSDSNGEYTNDATGTTHTAIKSIRNITNELDYQGVPRIQINKIIFTSLHQALEKKVLESGYKLLETSYLDNLRGLLNEKDREAGKDAGMSLGLKDKDAAKALRTRIGVIETELNAEFNVNVSKKTDDKNERGKQVTLDNIGDIFVRAEGASKEKIGELKEEILLGQKAGEKYEFWSKLDSNTQTQILDALDKRREEAENEVQKEITEQQEKQIDDYKFSLETAVNYLSSNPHTSINEDSNRKTFENGETEIERHLANIELIRKDAGNTIGSNGSWEGSTAFFTRINTVRKELNDGLKGIAIIKAKAAETDSLEKTALELQLETTEYTENLTKFKQIALPRITSILSKLSATNVTDDDFTILETELKSLLFISAMKPLPNRLGRKILKEKTLNFSNEDIRYYLQQIEIKRTQKDNQENNVKITIDPIKSRDVEVKVIQKLNTLLDNEASLTYSDSISNLQQMRNTLATDYKTGKINNSMYERLEKKVSAGITNLKNLIDKNYGSLKVFGDSTRKIQLSLLGISNQGINTPINMEHKVMYGVLENEHKELENYLIEVSEGFIDKKILEDGKQLNQKGMFLQNASRHNKAIRELAFGFHRKLMQGFTTPDDVEQYAENMDESKWSKEEQQIIKEVARFETKKGVLLELAKAVSNITIGGSAKEFVKNYYSINLSVNDTSKTSPKLNTNADTVAEIFSGDNSTFAPIIAVDAFEEVGVVPDGMEDNIDPNVSVNDIDYDAEPDTDGFVDPALILGNP